MRACVPYDILFDMKFRLILLAVLAMTPVLVFSGEDDFTRSLKVGMRGEDVRMLQVVLNTDLETRVAVSGAGSLGNETDYFGPATKRALIKFQEKYRAEVLTPVGLTVGTGFFGEKTRARASALRAKVSIANPVPIVQKGDVYVMFPSQYSGKSGTVITLAGAGFTTTGNTIYFGPDHAVVEASSWNGQSITFKVPTIPKGNYSIWVKNARGESARDAFFVVTDGITPEPTIESISPTHGGRGTTITLAGSGFVAKGNMVRTGINIVENISSFDGRTLSVPLPLDTLLSGASVPSSAKTTSIPIWVYLVNENGVSNGKSFTLEL